MTTARRITARWIAALGLAAGLASALWLGLKPPPPAPIDLVMRGYKEAQLRDDGNLLPVLFESRDLELCAVAPSEVDTSRWQGRFYVAGNDDGPRPHGQSFFQPDYRLGGALCFATDLLAGRPPADRLEVCGEIEDRYDGSRGKTRCLSLRYAPPASDYYRSYLELDRELKAILEAAPPLEELLASLDPLAEGAEPFPFFRLRLNRIALYKLRRDGSEAAIAEVHRRLADLPAWLDQPLARHHKARTLLDRAELHLAEGRFDPASRAYADAETLFRLAVGPRRIRAVSGQAALQAQVGAVRQGLGPLQQAIEECEQAFRGGEPVCSPSFVQEARDVLAWLLHLDPESGQPQRRAAAASLAASLEEEATAISDDLERANRLLSLAYFRLLDGSDPSPHLAGARQLLSSTASGASRARALEDWGDLIEALFALSRSDAQRALGLCQALSRSKTAEDSSSRDLAVWALSCTGQSHRLLGALNEAARSFEQALLRHEHASFDEIEQTLALGPGQRADDYYQAARVNLELGEPRAAWEILSRLDSLSVSEGELRHCRGLLDPDQKHALAENEDLRRQLFEELAGLERPASGSRRRQLEPVRQALKQRIQKLWHEQPGCPRQPPAAPAREPGYRAIPLDDEVLLLRRDAAGEVTLEGRHPISRRALQQLMGEIRGALAQPTLDDAAWQELGAPLARALLPRVQATPPDGPRQVVTYALHGVLQGAPLAALPLLDQPPGAPRWFGEVAIAALRPAGAPSRQKASPEAPVPPLFVVDPTRNLASAGDSLATYRDLFPGARFLVGKQATGAAFRRAVPGSHWLHVDAHGRFDPAFPELSAIALADGEITLPDLAALGVPHAFVNLSGCQTGRWPTTADSGRYGLAGLFTRLGVQWVIATNADLGDRLAADFNRAFYRRLETERDVPQAFAHALDTVRRAHPAASWGSLLLLQG